MSANHQNESLEANGTVRVADNNSSLSTRNAYLMLGHSNHDQTHDANP